MSDYDGISYMLTNIRTDGCFPKTDARKNLSPFTICIPSLPQIKAERDTQLRCQQAEQEERLASEMERIKLETDRDERIRRQVRENSLELRELETKLRDAYTG